MSDAQAKPIAYDTKYGKRKNVRTHTPAFNSLVFVSLSGEKKQKKNA